jgi:hypothetical protein
MEEHSLCLRPGQQILCIRGCARIININKGLDKGKLPRYQVARKETEK